MSAKLILNGIFAKKSPIHGYGVFAEKTIKKDDIVEECCTLFTETNLLSLANYYFKVSGRSAIMTGFGILYNHSSNPNVDYAFDIERNLAIFKATRRISKGEELTISYGENWFSCRDMPVKEMTLWKKFTAPKWPMIMRVLRGAVVCALVIALVQFLKHLKHLG